MSSQRGARRRSSRITLLILELLLCGIQIESLAQNKLRDYYHSAWSSVDGIGSVFEVYQDSDGYLWLTSSNGIFKFDGIKFQSVDEATNGAILNHDVDAVLPSRFGGMWFTTKRRTLVLWRNKRVVPFSDRRCTQGRKPGGMWEDRDGSLWIDASSGLARLHHGICEPLGPETGYPGGFTRGILLDSSGTLWAKTSSNELIYHPAGSSAFLRDAVGDGPVTYTSYIHEAPDKSIWISDTKGLRKVWKPGMSALASVATVPTMKGVEFANFTFDADGAIWAATDHGVERFADVAKQPLGAALDPAKGALFSKKDGLSSDDITNVLIDREHNIWVGTEAGLDRLRQNFFSTLQFDYDRTLQLGIAVGDANTVWVGSRRTPLTHVASDGHTITFPATEQVRSIRRDASGTIWAGKGTPNLCRIKANKLVSVPYPGKDTTAAVATDRNGDLWVSTFQPAILHRVDGVWRNENQAIGRKPGLIGAMTGDADGNVWFAFANNLVQWDGHAFHHYSYPSNLDITVFTLEVKNGHVWLAGGLGLLLFRNGRIEPVIWSNKSQPVSISGVVETKGGELWLNTFDGVVRVSKTELDRRLSDPSHAVNSQRYDTLDGLPGLPNDRWPDPSVVESGGGRLWFATSSGVGFLDPEAPRRAINSVPPTVKIEALKSQGKTFEGRDTIQLPPRAQNVEISYTALSLSIPERVRFRYKLEGIDKDWQDPGTRRLAFYAHLPAGQHRFRVIACNDDGIWNNEGAEMEFIIAPAFYETWWFKIAIGFMLCLLVWWGLRERVRQIRRQLEARHAERLFERERIARELHDTLLQGQLAVMMQFECALDALAEGDPTRNHLLRTLRMAQHVMQEGRERVRDLRANEREQEDLEQCLSATAFQLQAMQPVQFHVHVLGKRRRLHVSVQAEVLLVGREALTNSFLHANAKSIMVDISYQRRKLSLLVSDDGCGIPTEIMAAGMRENHWGLVGMRERAAKLKGTLKVVSKKNKGTLIELSVPGQVAYQHTAVFPTLLQLRRPRRNSGCVATEAGNRDALSGS